MSPPLFRLRPRPPYLPLFAAELFQAWLEAIADQDAAADADALSRELAALWFRVKARGPLDRARIIQATRLFARFAVAVERDRLSAATTALCGLAPLGITIAIQQPPGPHGPLGCLTSPFFGPHRFWYMPASAGVGTVAP